METAVKLKLQIVKKAWKIDFRKIKEGFLFCERICFADNVREAKKSLLNEVKYEELETLNGDDVGYLNIPVVRAKGLDVVLFDDKEIAIYEVSNILQKRKRDKELNKLLEDNGVLFCYIIKNGLYYRPSACGYTSLIEDAGIYKKEEAIEHARFCDEISLVPVFSEEHNKRIEDKIEELKTKLIK